MDVPDQPAIIHVAHDVLDAGIGEVGVRLVVHRQKDPRKDHDDEHDAGKRAEIPPIGQVPGRRVIDRLFLQEAENGESIVNPANE